MRKPDEMPAGEDLQYYLSLARSLVNSRGYGCAGNRRNAPHERGVAHPDTCKVCHERLPILERFIRLGNIAEGVGAGKALGLRQAYWDMRTHVLARMVKTP